MESYVLSFRQEFRFLRKFLERFDKYSRSSAKKERAADGGGNETKELMQMHDTRTFLRNRWPSVARSDRVKRSV